MHEMSIAVNILEIATAEARSAQAKTINNIDIDVGELAGIELESLLFCFETARKSYPETANSQLNVQRIDGLAHCHKCSKNVPADFFVATCPDCGQSGLELIAGRELKVSSINVD
jgi:hydrogenase nickel incorporation protein HypA/HybF